MSCGTKEALVFGMGLITGTGTTLTGKILYGVDSVGLDGEVKKFEKPIFQTWLMFLAMIFALPIHWAYHYYVERQWRHNNRNGMKYRYRIPRKMYFLLAFPAAFDLLATFVANLGLLYITEAMTPIRTPGSLTASAFSRSPLITRNAMKAAEIARRTPNPNDRDRVRREFMTEYQPLADPEARRRIDPAGHTYGSLET
ncbi:hypothetical protein BBI17_002637 [Phytophthora kernoviae]|uniref:Uncharacterized protein n=2 Tax=Phytophthora kernoviae TaxID=325452 RepID=A0A3R7INY9_9STRA|nr:hypothetical protein G195_003562 [Phytophthora kernoviae 00238/432]RLN44176.1 hypothetical protein BBI17_002637 [Phytophthora kernoviae]